MTTKPATALPAATTVLGSDLIVIVKGGIFYRTTAAELISGLPAATDSTKGIMVATDKLALTTLSTQMSSILAPPSTAIASAASITVPAGRYHITLSGTTEVTTVVGMTPRVPYSVSYPSGAGLTFMGETMKAGDTLLFIDA